MKNRNKLLISLGLVALILVGFAFSTQFYKGKPVITERITDIDSLEVIATEWTDVTEFSWESPIWYTTKLDGTDATDSITIRLEGRYASVGGSTYQAVDTIATLNTCKEKLWQDTLQVQTGTWARRYPEVRIVVTGTDANNTNLNFWMYQANYTIPPRKTYGSP